MECDREQRDSVYSTCARTIAALLLLLVAQADSSPFSDKASMNTVDLLTAFSGESAIQYEPFFRFSEKGRIVSVEIHAVGTESTTARYSSRETAWNQVNNILRITTADGFEGISGVDSYHQGEFSDEHLRELQGAAVTLLALQSLDPVEVGFDDLRGDLIVPTPSVSTCPWRDAIEQRG